MFARLELLSKRYRGSGKSNYDLQVQLHVLLITTDDYPLLNFFDTL